MLQLRSLLEQLPSRTIRVARKGVGSFLTFDVGRQHGSKAVADLHLWIYLCDWELDHLGKPLLSSSSAADAFPAALDELVGQDLQAIELGADPGEIAIAFSAGYRLRLRENLDEYEPEDDMLILYPRGAEPICYRAQRGFYCDSESS